MHKLKSGSFLATALASLANAGTAKHGSEFTSKAVVVDGATHLAVQLVATGADAAIAGDVTFYFAASVAETDTFDTFNDTSQAFAYAVLTMTTNAAERHTALIDVRGVRKIRLEAIANAGGKGIASVNVNYAKYYEVV